MRFLYRAFLLLILSIAAAVPAFSAELELRHQAIERLIAAQLFSQDGRHYVRGDKNSKCQFAYLESPHVGSVQSRMRVTARFSGRTALDMLGRCVGLGDSFDLTLTATPIVSNGALVLKDVNISTPRDSYYIRKVRQALAASFAKDFKIEVRDQAQHLFAQQPPPTTTTGTSLYTQELSSFDLRDVRVQPDALVLVFDFRLVVR